jgi:quinol monooxygenase YgiN
VILEKYSDADGLAYHRETEHFQRLGFGTIIPLLDRREVESHMVAGDAP